MEILYNGTWGTVCDNAWDINDAGVVCRHLGFTGALDAPRGAHFGSADDMTPIWLEVGPGLSIDFLSCTQFSSVTFEFHTIAGGGLFWYGIEPG